MAESRARLNSRQDTALPVTRIPKPTQGGECLPLLSVESEVHRASALLVENSGLPPLRGS